MLRPILNLIRWPRPGLSAEASVKPFTVILTPRSLWHAPKARADQCACLVKFIFPPTDAYNIYLHDTPSKSLFSRDVAPLATAVCGSRIRLNLPIHFWRRKLLIPSGISKRPLATGAEKPCASDNELPVHLIYRTAFKPRHAVTRSTCRHLWPRRSHLGWR